MSRAGRPYGGGFAHPYEKPKDDPFHFLHPEDERRYQKGFADCRARFFKGEFLEKRRRIPREEPTLVRHSCLPKLNSCPITLFLCQNLPFQHSFRALTPMPQPPIPSNLEAG